MPRLRTHPGEILAEEYLNPLGLSARALGEAIGVSGNRIRLLSKPANPLVVILDLTYDSLGGCTPTWMMVMCGLRRPDST